MVSHTVTAVASSTLKARHAQFQDAGVLGPSAHIRLRTSKLIPKDPKVDVIHVFNWPTVAPFSPIGPNGLP